ncbi:MAG: C39 family peptidase, partial [Chloroflexota bacterium]
MRNRKITIALLTIPVAVFVLALLYNYPPINNQLAWRISSWRSQIKYALNPPEEAVFIPQGQQGQVDAIVEATMLALTPTARLSPTPAPASPTPTSPGPTATFLPSPTPTITSTPLPESVILDGVVYVDQHSRWNYCGPANLTMALKFWGWPGSRDDIARVVKPGIQDPSIDFIQQGRLDKNVMPYEMADFVIEETAFNVVTRHGGDMNLVRRLLSGGFPVLIEKGYYEADYTGKIAWLGHYLFTTGYEDAASEFIVQDAYLKPGKDMRVDYETYLDGWQSFNYLFMVIYPPEREVEVFELLGPYANANWSYQHALDIAEAEAETTSGNAEFFAWFNKGT